MALILRNGGSQSPDRWLKEPRNNHNDYITISNIPKRAYEYIVNGKSAIEWILERYAMTVDKASGIVDNPNTYEDSKYLFDLLISVINVSIKTMDLIDSMPEYKEI